MIRAKKSFGQNWLVDETVVEKIINAAEIQSGESVVEIGPGTGALTRALADAGARVIAIEADAALVPALRERFGGSVELVEGDALSVELPLEDRSYKLVANIPYNITSGLLRRFLATPPRPTRMVLMVQREVADRIVAAPPRMSLLSVVCRLYAACSLVLRVPAAAFRPIPKVDSAVVRLDLKSTPNRVKADLPLCGRFPENIIALAKVGFSSRRKQLHGNLGALPHIESKDVKAALKELGLSEKARAQELTVENWIRLANKLRQYTKA